MTDDFGDGAEQAGVFQQLVAFLGVTIDIFALANIEFTFIPVGGGADIVEQRSIGQRLQFLSDKSQFATDFVGNHCSPSVVRR